MSLFCTMAAAMTMTMMIQLARCALKITYSMMIIKFSVCLKSFFYSILGWNDDRLRFIWNEMGLSKHCTASLNFAKQNNWLRAKCCLTNEANKRRCWPIFEVPLICDENVHAHVLVSVYFSLSYPSTRFTEIKRGDNKKMYAGMSQFRKKKLIDFQLECYQLTCFIRSINKRMRLRDIYKCAFMPLSWATVSHQRQTRWIDCNVCLITKSTNEVYRIWSEHSRFLAFPQFSFIILS